MTIQSFFRKWLLLGIIATTLVVSGCGGGGGGSSSGPSGGDDSQTVSGTAAAGAPLLGFVGARDASGGTTNANINADGSFELDLTELQPPVLLFASGISGGNAYQLLSVAFESDLEGTANITPLTDLVVGNTVGEDPLDFFNNPDFSQIQESLIEEQEAALKTRLKPLLDGLGVADDFDLRNSPFVADRSGFDAALDVIEVQVDSETNTATITNRIDRTKSISNNFVQPEIESDPIEVDEATLSEGISTLQATGTLVTAVANALDGNDRDALETLLAGDFLNNGENGTEWLDRLLGTEDAGELADDLRNWSLESTDNGTVNLNVGSPNGPWQAIDDNGDLKLRGNQLKFFAYAEATHIVENGAEPPVVQEIATSLLALNPVDELGTVGTSSVDVTGPQGTPFNTTLEAGNDLFGTFFVIGPNDLDQIQAGDQYTFTWNGASASAESTYTVRRGQPRFSEGAPEITTSSADLDANEYTFQWTLPPGYESVSVRNNFTGQTTGGEGGGFTGNPLDNDARSFTGDLPAGFSPQTDDEIRLIARDPFGVFVAARLINPFADQVPPPMAEDALIGSWIARNADRADNAPWVQLTFLESGYYMHQELDLPFRPEADDAGFTGLEFGQYNWDNETGELTVPDILIDDNGFWGLTDVASGGERVSFQVDGDTLTVFNPDVGLSESTEFTRVPLNQSGITSSWLVRDSNDPTIVSVVTLLEDGYYFVGTSQPADATGEPGMEFGTYTHDSDTTVLEATVASDDNGPTDYNGEFGLSDPMQGFDYATVIDGFLIIDDGEEFQLSELAPGVAPSDGTVTVDYTSPDDGNTGGTALTGDFHYLRNFSGIEGLMSFDPPLVFQSTYNHVGTSVADNGDGTGLINWTEICLGDLIVDANTDPINGDANFEFANECLPDSGSSFEVSFTNAGLSATFAEETTTDPEDGTQLRRGASSLDMIAVDANRSLFIGQSVRDFGFEDANSPDGFTDGIEVSAHVLSEKTTGRTQAELEGRWGLVTRYLTGVEGQPNALDYSANALIVDVDAAGAVTRLSEIDRTIIQGLASGESFVQIELNPEDTTQEPLGTMPITDDGTLSLFGGEFGGVLSADANVLFLALMNPMEVQPTVTNESEWIAGVRLADNFSATNLDGKEYEVISQSYWMQPEFFEVDYTEPGSTLSFDAVNNTASLTQALTFPYVPFINGEPLIREGDPESTDELDFNVDTSGRITLTTDFGEPGVTTFEMTGFSTPDSRLLVLATTVTTKADDGTTDEGSIGITYAICTNCD